MYIIQSIKITEPIKDSQSEQDYQAERRTAYNNTDITKDLGSLPYPEYSEEIKDYIKELYNDKETLLYQEIKFKPKKTLDLDFSFDLKRSKEIDNYTIQMKVPKVWKSDVDYGEYYLDYNNINAF